MAPNGRYRNPRGGRVGGGKGKPQLHWIKAYAPVKDLLIGEISLKGKAVGEFRFSGDGVIKEASPGLFFQRLVPVRYHPDREIKASALRPQLMKAWIQAVWNQKKALWNKWCRFYCQRTAAALKSFEKKGWSIKKDVFELEERMVVGLGQTNYWEVGMTWHRPSGLPYVPASALKGITRAKVMEPIYGRIIEARIKNRPSLDDEKFDQWLKALSKETQDKIDKQLKDETKRKEDETLLWIYELFGIQDHAGRAVFFDAFPVEAPKFVVDVMNVHYPSYYQGEGEADDTDSPNPVTFLAVDKGSKFCFAVAVRPPLGATEADDSEVEWVWNHFVDALAERGVGSKTRLGYGRFRRGD